MGSKISYKTYKLEDIGEIVTGKTPSTKIKENFGDFIPFVTPGDLQNGKFVRKTDRYLSKKGLNEIKNKYLPAGTIMVSCIGTVGEIAIAGEDCVTNQQINSIIPYDDFSRDYIYYNLKQRKNELQTFASGGSVVPIINKTDFSKLEIVLPNRDEQNRVGNILSSFDNKIELNQRMNETLEAIARAIFKSWFVDFDPVRAKMTGEPYPLPDEIMALFPDALVESELGMIPKGWEVGKLGDFIKIFDSERIPLSRREREKRNGNYPYYGATKIIDYIDDFIFNGIYVLMGEDGSVITEKGYPVLQYVWGKFWANNHAHVLQGKNGFSTEYLYLLLMKTNITPYVTGAVQLKLNQKNLKSIPIVFPSEEILSVFDSFIQVFFDKLRKNSEEVQILKRIRDTLLPKLMSGELEVDL